VSVQDVTDLFSPNASNRYQRIWPLIESLGFATADHGYNRGEVYTADGVHPILPISGFDKGYLKIDDIWRIWDTRYWTEIARNAPYQCNMLNRYYRFNIHSPTVFIPLVSKNAQ
jgi:hypothetical protein